MNQAFRILIGLLSIFVSNICFACGACGTAIQDLILPPILGWAGVAALFFVIQLIIIQAYEIRIKTFPSVWFGILIMVGFFIIGGVAFGLGLFVFLLLPVLLLAIRSIFRIGVQEWPDGFLKIERLLGFVAFLVIALLGSASIYIHSTRSNLDYIFQWPSSPISRNWIKQMPSRGEAGLADLRIIASKGEPWLASEAVAMIANHGNKEMDIPLILDVFRRVSRPQRNERAAEQYEIEQIEKALKIMSGIDLPPGSTAIEWELKIIEDKSLLSKTAILERGVSAG